jgi:hypothetical protein
VEEFRMNFYTVDFKPKMDGSQTYIITGPLKGCQVWQPTLDLELTGEIGSIYLHCMEVGTISYNKWGDNKLLYLRCMEVGTKVRKNKVYIIYQKRWPVSKRPHQV